MEINEETERRRSAKSLWLIGGDEAFGEAVLWELEGVPMTMTLHLREEVSELPTPLPDLIVWKYASETALTQNLLHLINALPDAEKPPVMYLVRGVNTDEIVHLVTYLRRSVDCCFFDPPLRGELNFHLHRWRDWVPPEAKPEEVR